jgi:hypothetical protein
MFVDEVLHKTGSKLYVVAYPQWAATDEHCMDPAADDDLESKAVEEIAKHYDLPLINLIDPSKHCRFALYADDQHPASACYKEWANIIDFTLRLEAEASTGNPAP